MTGLQSFSDWVLSALPRLFLYPGGLWLVAALLALRVASLGSLRSLRPITLARDFLSTQPLALALGWVGVALLPLPGGASALAFPADRLVLAALPLVSLAFDRESLGRSWWPSLAVTLALLAPVAVVESGLMGSGARWSPLVVLVMLAVATGALALWRDATHNLAGGARLLAWLGLGAMPLLGWPQPLFPGIAWASFVYALLVLVAAMLARFITRRVRPEALTVLAWALAGASLLFALLEGGA